MGSHSSRSSTETSPSIWRRSKPTRAVWWSCVTRGEDRRHAETPGVALFRPASRFSIGRHPFRRASPFADPGVELRAEPTGVQAAHRHHFALVGDAEDAGRDPLPSDLCRQLRRAHEVMAGESEAVDARAAANSLCQKLQKAEAGLGSPPAVCPAAARSEGPAGGPAGEGGGAAESFPR